MISRDMGPTELGALVCETLSVAGISGRLGLEYAQPITEPCAFSYQVFYYVSIYYNSIDIIYYCVDGVDMYLQHVYKNEFYRHIFLTCRWSRHKLKIYR